MNQAPDAIQRSCAFCGGRPLTREHVLPGWLTKNRVVRFDETTGHLAPNGTRSTRPISPGNQTAKAFCEACNTGWMSDLEDAAQPLLTPLIGNDRTARLLSADDQAVLGFWAAKTAVTCQFVNPRDQRHVSQRHRREMHTRKAPATGTNVWIAPHRSPQAFEALFSWTGLTIHHSDQEPPEDWTSFGATLGLGKLLITVLHFEPGDYTGTLQADWGKFTHRLTRVWPPAAAPLHWPPSGPALAESECIEIVNAARTGPVA